MARVVHFELAADDPARAVAFYANVFGWQINQWGDQAYWLASTGAPGTPGIDGAIRPREDPAMPAVVNTIDVASIDEAVAKVLANGGTIAMPKMVVPGVGYLAYCNDTEGIMFGMMQSDPAAMP